MKTFKHLMCEISQPKSKDELNFKKKHEIEMIDHPESEEHQHTSDIRARKRLADYEKGEDMTVYETAYERDLDPNKPIVIKGVKGMNSRSFTKKFRNMKAFDKWADSDAAGDFEIHQVMNEGRASFMGAVAAAKKAGKKKFKLGGREFPVKMKKDTADEILDEDMDWKKDSELVRKSKDPKFISKMIDKWGERGGAWLNHPALKENKRKPVNEAFKRGSLKLNDGSSVVISDKDSKLLNQMFDDLNPKNRREMMKVLMTDEDGFEEILGFAKEAL